TSGLGTWPLCGRMRVPSPAARTMATRGAERCASSSCADLARDDVNKKPPESDRLQRRHMLIIPLFEDRLGWVGERALKIAPYARHMSQILRLAVASVEPAENPQDLAGALGRERNVALDEGRPVEFRLPGVAALDVAAEQCQFGLFRHVDAGILEDRGEVIAARAHQ